MDFWPENVAVSMRFKCDLPATCCERRVSAIQDRQMKTCIGTSKFVFTECIRQCVKRSLCNWWSSKYVRCQNVLPNVKYIFRKWPITFMDQRVIWLSICKKKLKLNELTFQFNFQQSVQHLFISMKRVKKEHMQVDCCYPFVQNLAPKWILRFQPNIQFLQLLR